MKKDNRTVKFAIIVLALTMIALILVAGTYAKYTSSGSGTDSVKVANAGSVLLPEKYRGGAPPIRELSIYETIMERSRING